MIDAGRYPELSSGGPSFAHIAFQGSIGSQANRPLNHMTVPHSMQQQVRERAKGLCECCHLPDTLATLPSCFGHAGCAALPPILVLLVSLAVPTPMEERILQWCGEREEGYTAMRGHCGELHMIRGLGAISVERHDGLTTATLGGENGGIAFKSDRSRGHH
jgi:hypothetical protein